MNNVAVRGWLLLAVVVSLAYAGWTKYRVERARAESTANRSVSQPADRMVDDFTLTDQTGKPFGFADLKGRAWIASFFFTGCPGTCRQLNQTLAAIQEQTPDNVRLVSITCDPENDTPQALAQYAEFFHADTARWKFLTGEMRDLKRVGQDIFQVTLKKGNHSEKAFVVDRTGEIRGGFNVLEADGPEKLKQLVKQLEAEEESEPQGRKDAEKT